MLTGRESLIRVVGKRRRYLPNLSRLLSPSFSSDSHSSLSQPNDQNETGVSDATLPAFETSTAPSIDDDCPSPSSANGAVESDYVNCPVCGSKIRGDDTAVNSHLDVCLVRGKKRKLSQRTLLQFSFCSRLKSKASNDDEFHLESIDIPGGAKSDPTQKSFPHFSGLGTNETSYDNIQCQLNRDHGFSPHESSLSRGSITQYDEDHVMEKIFVVNGIDHVVDTSPLPLRSVLPNSDTEGVPRVLSGLALETYIVGRKFGDRTEIISGSSIYLVRDCINVRDPNAIKVLSAESYGSKSLGYLPRELAQHLSPLIDNYQLSFVGWAHSPSQKERKEKKKESPKKGVITSVPENSLDVVPIEIMCLQTPSFEEMEKDGINKLKTLCENVIISINAGKKSPPTIAKYQQNFRLIIEEAIRSNLNLFTDDENKFLESFSSMSDDSQRLFVRLYMRKGPWFRISNLSYPEILDCKLAANELSEASYVCSFGYGSEVNPDEMEGLLNLLSVSELCEILQIVKKGSNAGLRKKDLIASLHSSYKDGFCPLLPSLIFDRTAMCIQISSIAESVFWRVQRLFFLNGEQDLSAFLLVDLGIVKYPEYKCIISDPVFSERSEFLAYEEAVEVAQIMDQSLDEENSELVLRCTEVAESQLSNCVRLKKQSIPRDLVAPFLECFSAAWVYSKVGLLGVSYFEQQRRYQDAIKLLKLLLDSFTSNVIRGYWTLRLSINLEHIGCLEESLSVAEDGVLDPSVRAGSRMALQRRVIRLGRPPRRWKAPSYASSVKRKITEVHIQGRPLNSKVGTKSRFYGEDGEQCGVEELALQFYAGEGGGWQGVHTESGIWLTIYGLLMWDIIFADVPNVFRNRFQNGPLDMDNDHFYVARSSLIESHLQKIHEGMAEEILIMSWESHLGVGCRGVKWERHSLSELRAAVTCIGGPCLANMCRLLAQEYRSWSSGMPDLLLWRFNGAYKGEAKLVEVKGPKDRLSEQQRAWLLTLMDCGFNAEVCKVTPQPST